MEEINDELIAKFFSGLCTKEEKVKVLAYLKQFPEHPYLLNEWNGTDALTPLTGHYTQEMYDVVVQHTAASKKGNPPLLRLLAAASCIACVIISMWFFRAKHEIHPIPVATNHMQETRWIVQQNTGAENKVIMLADSSRITLSPQAWIRYKANFGIVASRRIYMKGDVFFEVAKNKGKPFTVYSGYISTTALGTVFRVTAPEKGETIKVHLNEGKVVIALTDTVYRKMHADYYLLPGQELVFNAENKPGILHAFFIKTSGKKAVATGSVKQENKDESYVFNNQTLPDVLEQLSVIYGVPIMYSKADIGKIYFIGRIERNDSVEKTIDDIALLNKLSVTKKNGGFMLKLKVQ